MAPQSNFPPPPDSTPGKGPWLWVALGCGGCLVLSTAALVALVLLIGRTVQFAVGPDGVKTDQAPFTFTIPGESEGVMDMTMFGMQIIQVTSTDTPPSVLLTMGRLPSYLQSSADQSSFIESFQEGMVGDETYQFSLPTIEERPLCDTTVAAIVQTGEYQADQAIYAVTSLMATVDYNRRTQFVWILAHGDSAAANVDQVFDSLECQ
jgi:hypothetical protein